MNRIKTFLHSETVLVAAAVAAGISMAFVPPSVQYAEYIDFRVLSLLFCLMAVVGGMQKIGAFAVLGRRMIAGAHNTRLLCMALVLLCFFSSMLITNDVALITFVPFAVLVLTMTGQTKNLIYVIVLQTVAANLGSMLTPVGNPQNLYLYSYYHMAASEFFRRTLPVTAFSLVLLLLLCLGVKAEHIRVRFTQGVRITSGQHMAIYTALFALCLLCVFHLLPWAVLFALVVATVLVTDRSLFRRIDYGLLATFVCFFIFVGNIARIEPVRALFAEAISGHERLAAIALSQIISNVPAAVLLSGFTDRAGELLLGVNLGGLGTLVASLASLISFKLYIKNSEARTGRYLAVFTVVNVGALLALTLISSIVS